MNIPSIWTDESDNQPTGVAPPEAARSEALPSTQQRGDGSASSSSPDDEDTYDSQIRLPPRIRTQFGGGLRTAGDAYIVCEALFSEQIERAAAESPLPNVAISGDSGARTAFLLLLTDTQQRELFLKVGANPAAWPRLKSLVGSPPYHFLLPSDAGALNAAGFARGRVNMTYDQGGKVASHAQFGPGQLVDEHTREYRVAPRRLDPSDPLPGPEYFRASTKDIVLQVKVKKHGLKKKHELFHSVFIFMSSPCKSLPKMSLISSSVFKLCAKEFLFAPSSSCRSSISLSFSSRLSDFFSCALNFASIATNFASKSVMRSATIVACLCRLRSTQCILGTSPRGLFCSL